ncbi:hypothetical protein [Brachybacterium kimchii]|uniref:Uncharacterized protein n=1 Tax=Brachybacterium kimchii TaxID=2942909 RepID=A0ABY4NB37_9MICO|nr:hypothetical protein [Brachybacterium kimchii]UQN30505.1 hypothetical protein M4486_03945 [Brachybacterium kimchii]
MDGDLEATYGEYLAAQELQRSVDSVLIAYRLTLSRAPEVESIPSFREPSLPDHSIRVRCGDDSLTLLAREWSDRMDEVRPFLREWIRARAPLENARLRPRSRRRDPFWVEQWRKAHPWG